MGIEHEKIHLETTTVLVRLLPLEFIKKEFPDGCIFTNTYQKWICDPKSALENEYIEFGEEDITIGRPEVAKINSQEHAKNLKSKQSSGINQNKNAK